MATERNCITIFKNNAYCKKPAKIKDLKRWEGSTFRDACQNRCNKGKLLASGGEYQNLEYDCGGSFIYNTKKGKERCYHCDNKGDIKINSAMNNLQLCDTAYTNYITTYHPGRQDMIKPDQCNWDMLSDDYKSQYTLKNNCTWDNLSETKRKTANDIATQGMITPDQCNWDNLSEVKRKTVNDTATVSMRPRRPR